MMRQWIHHALKGASLTTALFVFQACYGTPPGPYMDETAKQDVAMIEEAPAAEPDGEAATQAAAEAATNAATNAAPEAAEQTAE